jgi:hypothetical protein
MKDFVQAFEIQKIDQPIPEPYWHIRFAKHRLRAVLRQKARII